MKTTTARAATHRGPQVYISSAAPPPARKMPLKGNKEIQVSSLSLYNIAMNFYGQLYVKNTTSPRQGHNEWIWRNTFQRQRVSATSEVGEEGADTFLILVITKVSSDHRSNSDLCVSCKKKTVKIPLDFDNWRERWSLNPQLRPFTLRYHLLQCL